jgi:FimV-like protein
LKSTPYFEYAEKPALVSIRVRMRNSSQAATPSEFATAALRRGLMVAALSSATMLYSTLASALGMGDITLHSALNQPLNAEIELVETAGLSADDVVARLASPEEFARAGVDRVFFFNDLRFTPVIRGNRGVIHVVSSKPVTEPYLQFLVQVLRPGGDMLHEYTLLLDPATSAAGRAAVAGRAQAAAVQATEQSRMPVAPPVALQGKRYSVVGGDTLNSIARRMQGSGASASAGRLADGIKSLNPQAFPNGDSTALKVGQSLLLPDAANVPNGNPTAAVTPPVSPAPPAAEVQRGAEQLASAAIENQILTKTVEDLRSQLQGQQVSIDGKDKQIVALQTELAERQTAAQPVSVAPVPAPFAAAPGPEPQEDSLLTSPLMWGAVAILLLLLGLAWSVRRNRHKQTAPQPVSADPALIKPARASVVPVSEPPVTAARVVAPTPSPAASRPAAVRSGAGSNDALDGVSIYIAYGRFAEAMGILRTALAKQPERTDIRIRILELLAEQGDSAGFAQEEQLALENGVSAEELQQIRSRYPKLQPAEDASVKPAVLAAAPAVAAITPVAMALDEPAQLDENAAAALNPEPADEFQLNLDDLSMDADWDLVDPFEKPKTLRTETPVEPTVAQDPEFASNLTQLPEVQEIPDDRFLSDFPEEEVLVVESNSDALDDAFLDGFMDESGEFDLLDLDEVPLSKVNQAQVLIDDGDIEGARALLLEVLEESDEEHQQTARDLLAGL